MTRRDSERQILVGRKEIAKFIGISDDMVSRMINLKMIKVLKVTPHVNGLVLVTAKKLLEVIDQETDRQNAPQRDAPFEDYGLRGLR